MPPFVYKVRSKTGQQISGVMHGRSVDEVAGELFTRGFTPIEIRPEKPDRSTVFSFFANVTARDLIVFTRQLAALIKAGISFMKTLDTLYEQTKNKKLKNIIGEMKSEVRGGASFSEALLKFPSVFSPLYVSMVRVGEEAGVLDEMLERLAVLLEHDDDTKTRVKTALRYPLIVIVTLFGAFLFLTAFVVPKFAAIFASSKVALPFPTRMLIFLNHLITNYGLFMLAGIVAIVILLKTYIKTASGRWKWDKIKLRVPILGNIVEKSVMSRFSRIFATLYRSGIPMLHALDIVSGTLGNVVVGRAVDVIKADVRDGKSLVEPMTQTGVFPPIVIQMVAVGEESGSLDEMLVKAADYFDLEVEYEIRNLSTTIEPIMIFILALGVLFLALGIFLPIWDMINVLKR